MQISAYRMHIGEDICENYRFRVSHIADCALCNGAGEQLVITSNEAMAYTGKCTGEA